MCKCNCLCRNFCILSAHSGLIILSHLCRVQVQKFQSSIHGYDLQLETLNKVFKDINEWFQLKLFIEILFQLIVTINSVLLVRRELKMENNHGSDFTKGKNLKNADAIFLQFAYSNILVIILQVIKLNLINFHFVLYTQV